MKIRIYDSNRRTEPKSGYGLISAQLVANLKDFGHDICFFPRENETEDIALWIRPPHYIKYPEFEKGRKNVFFTMHELETFEHDKSNWAELLNKCDAIIVPTEWNKKVFEKNGVTKPIHVVPLGVNGNDFPGAKTYNFSILTLHEALGSDNSRENWKDTIRAYYKAFSGKKCDVLLTIKSYNIKRNQYYDYLYEIQKEFKKTLPVEIVEVNLTKEGLNSLYSNHWLFLKNANREGWSLPLIEAMATGMDVAYTDLPVFEWAEGYKNKSVFPEGDVDALVKIFKKKHKEWQKEKAFVQALSWKYCAIRVEDVLKKCK